MIIRKSERKENRAVRFNGVGEISMLPILPLGPEALCNKGRLFAELTLKPGEVFGSHSHHGEFEIFLILSGVGTLNNNGTTEEVYPGDVCVCKDGEEHGIANKGTEDLRYVALILNTGSC